jgi:hypothetical protein
MQSVLCSNPFMAFAMAGILSVRRSFILHLLGISLIPIYFIASFGVMVMLKNVKAVVKIFIYTWDLYLC